MKFSKHFTDDVFPKRQYLTIEILEEIVNNPLKIEVQSDLRTKIWGYSLLYDKFIRIVLDEDGETLITAFFDRDYK